ncbi:PREDICTED: meiotic nuclear division protein 1 homolog [Nicrophorus vespilloides]|uniref:Meiotic nuclear division protein 1 homolog n=1 Tax=Nicrophorus vespilloides TaxID=110193 RepID=A0ABM1MSH7_NICVS|nr:PREDICTED: meiotic nuclear division protein 1 homolog [Nicrophorus vespilloides]XP_017777535.1 PREDICTED: meiotic nuclear division protein 1 homolog [Nicrophorus vespilloides]
MSKKGVSAEEKKQRIMQIFYEQKTWFQLKELEKIAPKEKGVIANSVKDVVQSLVDDGLVETDKIGSSIYFWAFPSQALNIHKKKLKNIEQNLQKTQEQLKTTTEAVGNIQINSNDEEEKKKLLEKIIDLQVEKQYLANKLTKCQNNDKEMFESQKNEIKDIKLAANRWTDNIFQLKTWCRDRFMIESSVIDKQFGIPEELDYVE